MLFGAATLWCVPESMGKPLSPKARKTGPRDIFIHIKDDSLTGVEQEKIKRLTKACENFSVYLTKNRGLWASGPFASAVCEIQTSGSRATPTEKEQNVNPIIRPWRLNINSTDARKKFEILYHPSVGQPSTESTYEIETEIPLTTLLEKHEFSQLIAAYLSNSLPIRSAITGSRVIEDGTITVKSRGSSSLTPESPNAEIFQIRRSGPIWITRLVGTAEIRRKAGNTTILKVTRVEVDPVDESPLPKPQSIYFVHQLGDRGANLTKIDNALRSRMETFFSKFLDIGRSAYLGARYGAPLQKGKGVLANTSLIGVFGEFRGGVLSGLRLNYDAIPTQKAKTDETTDEFSWSRIQLGYGFGIRFDNPFMNWIDISPKLGVTNLLLKSTANPDATTEGYEFKLFRAPTVGLEIGVEKRTNEFLLRLWGYGSYSLGVLPIDKEYKSTSLRAGIDIYRELFDWKSIKLAVLVFSAADQNQYTRLISTQELAENPNTTTEVKFGSLFAGGGLTLTW